MAAPGEWRTIHAGPGRDDEIREAANAAFAGADRDSAAVDKHWMRERLTRAFDAGDDATAEVVTVLYPERTVAGVVLPVTATVLRLNATADSMEAAMKSLALAASRDPSSQVVVTDAGVTMRTHAVVNLRRGFDDEVDAAPVSPEDRAAIKAAAGPLPSLRVRYLLPGVAGASWHALAFSAMLGTDEPGLVDIYLSLCDALATTAKWRTES